MYQFCNGDLNKFVFLLRKSVYPYEYMDNWERFNETSLPPKKGFYSVLTLKDIREKDFWHGQKVFEEYCTDIMIIMICMFKLIYYCLRMFLKNLETNALKYMDLIFLFFICTWISMASMFKKDRSKIRIINDYHMLLMIEE